MHEVAYSLWPVTLWIASVFLFIIGLSLAIARKTGLMGLLLFWIAAALLFWLGFNIQDHNQVKFPGEVPMSQQAPSVPQQPQTPASPNETPAKKPATPLDPSVTPAIKQEAIKDAEDLEILN